MPSDDKFLFRLELPQRKFLNRVPRGMRGHITRQCLDVGALLKKEGLLTKTGVDIEAVRVRLERCSVSKVTP
jgi:hypothetical protein